MCIPVVSTVRPIVTLYMPSAHGIPIFAWKGETLEEYDWCIVHGVAFLPK